MWPKSPQKFFAIFSATARNFNLKFYTFICWNLLHQTAKQNLILLKNDEVIDFLTWPPTDFSAFKNVHAKISNQNSKQLLRKQRKTLKGYFFCHTLYVCVSVYIPNVIDCHLTKRYPISIILGTFILGTTGYQMTIQNFTSPSVCFCTTWVKQNQRNVSLNAQKYVKKHFQRMIDRF